MSKPKILISILNWNRSQKTIACVESLGTELDDLSEHVTVYVIDNGSSEEDVANLQSPAKDKKFFLKCLPVNLGFTGGHNVAIKKAIDEDYDFIWLLNNDAIVKKGALAKLVELMSNESACGAASPVICFSDDEENVEQCLNVCDFSSLSSRRIASVREAEEIQSHNAFKIWLSGAAIFLRVEALKKIGMLDDDLFAYFDDNDLGCRLSKAGWYSKFVASAKVIHEMKKNDGTSPLYYYYLMQRNEMLFWHKNTPLTFRRFLQIRLLDRALFNAGRLYRMGLKNEGDVALLGVFDYLRGRFGPPRLDAKVPKLLKAACALNGVYNRKNFSRVKM